TSKEFVIVHAGKLGINEVTGRSSVTLLDGLAGLFRIRPSAQRQTRLVFVGPEDPQTARLVVSRGLSANVICTGQVSYEDSLSYVADASLCVVVEGNFKEGIFLPSKLCDYLIARKPVLALSPERGTVADMAREGGIQHVGPQDAAGTVQALARVFDAFRQSRLQSYQPSEALARRFEDDKVIGDFLGSIASLTRNSIAVESS